MVNTQGEISKQHVADLWNKKRTRNGGKQREKSQGHKRKVKKRLLVGWKQVATSRLKVSMAVCSNKQNALWMVRGVKGEREKNG